MDGSVTSGLIQIRPGGASTGKGIRGLAKSRKNWGTDLVVLRVENSRDWNLESMEHSGS